MYVRIKTISGRRYVYLVEGRRENGKVVQRSLSYLGVLPIVALGISVRKKRRIQSRIIQKIEWSSIANRIREIPLTFEELNELRKYRLSFSLNPRSKRLMPHVRAKHTFPENIFRARKSGELKALAKLAAVGFENAFEQIGPRQYRMKV